MSRFLLYGANGYTGKLIAKMAKSFNLEPILAGRSELKIQKLAEDLGYEYRIFSLNDADALKAALDEVPVVLHAAGPYKYTAKPMIEACIETKTHYLDITGEIEVFEMAHSYHAQAEAAAIMIMPGTGFDVVPTDCLALHLKNQLPDATNLKLAFVGSSSPSHGTATTMAENLGKPGARRENGEIIDVPVGEHSMWVPFPEKKTFAISIPWGDVSTAYYSTGIPNIETFMGFPPSQYKYVKMQRYFGWLLRTNLVRNYIKKQIKKRPAGPSEAHREKAVSQVWGEVSNANGNRREARLTTLEGYKLTATTALLITQKVLNGNAPIGFQTPAKAYGADLILEVDNSHREDPMG